MSVSAAQRNAISLQPAGRDGWTCRARVDGGVVDVLVLRSPEDTDPAPPAASVAALEEVFRSAAGLKALAEEAICNARGQHPFSGRGEQSSWAIVEVRIDQGGKPWLGLYQSGSASDVWMVQFEADNRPVAVWRRARRDGSHRFETGSRLF